MNEGGLLFVAMNTMCLRIKTTYARGLEGLFFLFVWEKNITEKKKGRGGRKIKGRTNLDVRARRM